MEKLKYLWHEDVHKRFHEALTYIQITFLPVYKRKDIFDKIVNFMEGRKICSYCVYEIYGYYDLLLRVWVPHSQQPVTDFRKDLYSELVNLGCIKIVSFHAENNLLHWKWWDQENKLKLIPRDVDKLPEDIIRKVDNEQSDESEVDELDKQHILKKYTPCDGIKFFVVIPPPAIPQIPSETFTEIMVTKLQDLMVKTKGIDEPSVYIGDGFAWVLIKGKILFQKECYIMLNNLVQEINEIGLEGFYIRTYTYLVTGSTHPYCIETEGISNLISPFVKKPEIVYYLTRAEDEHFEIKSSLLFNIDRYVRDKTKGDLRDTKVALEGVLKALVGLLNAEGGEILIGVLETPRYADVLAQANNPLQGLPRVGERMIFGINYEYSTQGWEGFCNKLSEIVSAHIGSDASALIKVRREVYEGKDLCVIDVPKGPRWYYLNNKEFFVRRANSTSKIEGIEMDSYKRLYQRVG